MKPTFRTKFDMCFQQWKSFNPLGEMTPLSYKQEEKKNSFIFGRPLKRKVSRRRSWLPSLKEDKVWWGDRSGVTIVL